MFLMSWYSSITAARSKTPSGMLVFRQVTLVENNIIKTPKSGGQRVSSKNLFPLALRLFIVGEPFRCGVDELSEGMSKAYSGTVQSEAT